jgi:hypothetical protein
MPDTAAAVFNVTSAGWSTECPWGAMSNSMLSSKPSFHDSYQFCTAAAAHGLQHCRAQSLPKVATVSPLLVQQSLPSPTHWSVLSLKTPKSCLYSGTSKGLLLPEHRRRTHEQLTAHHTQTCSAAVVLLIATACDKHACAAATAAAGWVAVPATTNATIPYPLY